jgi:hypothetical protein
MNLHRLALCLLPGFKKSTSKGFTTFDLIAHIFLIGLVVMAMPIFFNTSTPEGGVASSNRKTLLIRMNF